MARWGSFEADCGCVGDFACLFGSNLLLCILAQLDVHTLVRLRCVCKSWYDAVIDPALSCLRSEGVGPWLLLRERIHAPENTGEGLAYIFDPELHSELYDYFLEMEAQMQLWQPGKSDDNLCASALPACPSASCLFLGLPSPLGGLVCGRLMEHKHALVFAVGNPVLNRWKILPEAPLAGLIPGKHHAVDEALIFDVLKDIPRPPYLTYTLVRSSENKNRSSRYKLVVCRENLNFGVDFLVQYDREQDNWTHGPCFSFETPSAIRDDARSLLDASIFVTSRPDDQGLINIAAYDANSMQWFCVAVPNPSVSHHAVFKLERRGLILMAGLVADFDEFLAFVVWELDIDNKVWKLASKIEARDLLENCDLDIDIKLQLVGDWIVFSCWYKNSTFGLSFPPVLYHVPSRKWQFSVSPYDRATDFECLYAFQPSVTDMP